MLRKGIYWSRDWAHHPSEVFRWGNVLATFPHNVTKVPDGSNLRDVLWCTVQGTQTIGEGVVTEWLPAMVTGARGGCHDPDGWPGSGEFRLEVGSSITSNPLPPRTQRLPSRLPLPRALQHPPTPPSLPGCSASASRPLEIKAITALGS